MNRYLFALLLLLPCTAYGQPVVVGLKPTPEQVKEAKQVQLAAEPKILTLKVGEFEVIEPAKGIAGPLLWIVADETICQRLEVAPNQPMVLWMQRRGEPGPALHNFDAKPYRWAILVGVKAGQSVTHIVRNGATATEAPVVLDRLEITVGTPKPPPPPPDLLSDFEKSLKKAMEADVKTGLGTKTHAELLAGIYRGAANSLPAAKTVGELYATLQRAISVAGIPPPGQALPSMRQLIATELNKKLPLDADKEITLEDRNRLTATFVAMADSLEAILGGS